MKEIFPMKKSVKFIQGCCCVLGVLLLTTLYPLTTAWADPLHDAVKSGDLQKVKRLIEKGAEVNVKDKYGRTPLFFTLSPEIIELLIKKGTDVNAKDNLGGTPLHRALNKAAQSKKYEKAKLLIEKGANVNAKDRFGRTPLFELIAPLFFSPVEEKGDKEMVQLLIQKGANVNVKSLEENTPLSLAIGRGHKDIAGLLRKHGAKE